MLGDVRVSGDEAGISGGALGGDQALCRAGGEGVEVLARGLDGADDGLIELERQRERQAGDEGVVERGSVAAELVGEGDDDEEEQTQTCLKEL